MLDKEIELCGFTFVADFDSANLARVEYVPTKLETLPKAPNPPAPNPPPNPQPSAPPKKHPGSVAGTQNRFVQKKMKTTQCEFPDYEFNIWTNPDCCGTEFENSNRTWFHFGVRGGTPFSLVKLNIVDLNKQSKMYSQGMAPVCKIYPGRNHWERINDKPVFTSENNVFTLSFKFRALENPKATIYFAFTYPFSYTDLQNYLSGIDTLMGNPENHLPKAEIRFNKGLKINNDINDAIYYHRETLCYSLEYRNVDLITISSHHNITSEREPRIDKLFPDENRPRPFRFHDKKVIFISARVHPGETPSSFVFNGLLNLLVQKDDPIAILLRRQYVFKLIPMLNPDGVARGHYRTDTRGCNLNRFYLNPSFELHPSIYAARALIRYHHYGALVPDDFGRKILADESNQADPNDMPVSEFVLKSDANQRDIFLPGLVASSSEIESTDTVFKSSTELSEQQSDTQMKDFSAPESVNSSESSNTDEFYSANGPDDSSHLFKGLVNNVLTCQNRNKRTKHNKTRCTPRKAEHGTTRGKNPRETPSRPESGLFLYIDMHGHASKKGIFMYGNHFDEVEDSVECMLLPKIMSVNSQNFHFPACNFTEKNMYLRDKRDGTSREGSGRVAVLRITGLVRSYTLECNYNTGRFVNVLPQCSRDLPTIKVNNLIAPPKYSPAVFEEIGRALGVSVLDLTNSNPWSRIPNSEYHTLYGIRDWLKLKTLSESFLYQRPRTPMRAKPSAKTSQTQVVVGILTSERKLLPNVRLAPLRLKQKIEDDNNAEDSERKENLTMFQGTSKTSALLSRRQQGTTRRSMNRISNVLQVHRAGSSRSVRSIAGSSKKGNFRIVQAEKVSKFKQFTHKTDIPGEEHPPGETETRVPIPKVSLGLNCDRGKMQSLTDSCGFKQSPKRLKISKAEGEGSKVKTIDWGKEDAVPGPSTDIIVYSRIARPLTHLGSSGDTFGHGKKRTLKRSQLSPVKYKKSVEMKRGNEVNRKKIKTLFKKAGKVVLSANDINKNVIETKRRKN
ncbi:UNVERIFIED_CONTAM: hypothetical protein PYX00_002994 [Menopon gallinae]|uniref:tubulin-glutamate carboxypeptidase n=1 Tax=Menopon gallinae TaxID=328185 RepID=A0AAW2HY64_9NEOP